MRHPFELEIYDLEAIDLNVEKDLTTEEAMNVAGGLRVTTLALGEEGGCSLPPISKPPIDIVTTQAIGEEGGDPGNLY